MSELIKLAEVLEGQIEKNSFFGLFKLPPGPHFFLEGWDVPESVMLKHYSQLQDNDVDDKYDGQGRDHRTGSFMLTQDAAELVCTSSIPGMGFKMSGGRCKHLAKNELKVNWEYVQFVSKGDLRKFARHLVQLSKITDPHSPLVAEIKKQLPQLKRMLGSKTKSIVAFSYDS